MTRVVDPRAIDVNCNRGNHGPTGLSIAEAVGDSRIKRFTCFLCKQEFFKKRGNARRMCMWCAEELERQCKAAVLIVKNAIKDGKLVRPDTLRCVDCGKPANCYDHRSYLEPLVVEATCTRCNYWRGPAKFVLAQKNLPQSGVGETPTEQPDESAERAAGLFR